MDCGIQYGILTGIGTGDDTRSSDSLILKLTLNRVVPIQKKGPSQNEQKPPLEEVFQDLFLLYGIQYHFFEFL